MVNKASWRFCRRQPHGVSPLRTYLTPSHGVTAHRTKEIRAHMLFVRMPNADDANPGIQALGTPFRALQPETGRHAYVTPRPSRFDFVADT